MEAWLGRVGSSWAARKWAAGERGSGWAASGLGEGRKEWAVGVLGPGLVGLLGLDSFSISSSLLFLIQTKFEFKIQI